MLHEIFKGMDNAAEQINENFQNGSIVDEGVNENGRYVKYASGIMVCTVKGFPQVASTNYGSMYRTGSTDTWTFPHEFLEVLFHDGAAENTSRWTSTSLVDNSSLIFRQYSPIDGGTIEVENRLIAIGRWKE